MTMQMLQMKHDVNFLQTKLKSTYNGCDESFIEKSTELVLCGIVKFQVKHNIYKTTNYNTSYEYHHVISIKLSKIFEPDQLIYAVRLQSATLKVPSESIFRVNEKTENAFWRIIYETRGSIQEFDFALSLDLSSCAPTPNGFSFLEDDTELCDFELRGVDGAVRMHKAVLAGFSPVMRTMFNGEWKETSEGAIDIPNTSKKTLEQLKDYMYKQQLPTGTSTGIKKLAALASYYMMSDLEDRCVVKLLGTLSSENASSLLSIAVKYNIDKLMLGILENIQNGGVRVEDMNKHFRAKLLSDKGSTEGSVVINLTEKGVPRN